MAEMPYMRRHGPLMTIDVRAGKAYDASSPFFIQGGNDGSENAGGPLVRPLLPLRRGPLSRPLRAGTLSRTGRTGRRDQGARRRERLEDRRPQLSPAGVPRDRRLRRRLAGPGADGPRLRRETRRFRERPLHG